MQTASHASHIIAVFCHVTDKFCAIFREHTPVIHTHCACCLATQSSSTLSDPGTCGPPGSSVRGILQARIREWVAISSPGHLPNPGTESFYSALAGGFFNVNNLGSLHNIVV